MQDIYIGRQAIFDREMNIYAYELLFRSGQHNASNIIQSINGDLASSEVILNAFMEIGLDRIAGPHRVFINMTRTLFLNHPEIHFEKDRVVLELLEDIAVDDELIKAVTELSKKGHQLALDDYAFEADSDPLLPLVDIVKVEVPALSIQQIHNGLPRLRAHGVKLLAEKIETEEEHQQMLDLGFDYFQGYHFSRPKVISGKRLEENQMVILRIVSELNDPQVGIENLETLITQDAILSYKILRYINSAAIGMPRQVESVRQAVIYMGLDRIRALASLLTLTRQKNKPQAYFTTALVRAHMCKQLVTVSGDRPPETGFTVGLLSILDLLMDRPIAEIVKELSLTNEIKSALLEQRGIAGSALSCAIAYESHAWEDTGYVTLRDGDITNIYLNASEMAFRDLQALAGID